MGNGPTWLPTLAPDICIIFLCSTGKNFKTLKILFSTRLIRERDNFLHIILFSIHFFERTPLKHVEKKHGFDLWRVTVAAHKHHPSHAHQVTECKHPLLWHRPKEAYSSVLWAWLTHGDPTLIGRDCHVILSKQRTLHVYRHPWHAVFITCTAITVFH